MKNKMNPFKEKNNIRIYEKKRNLIIKIYLLL